MSNERKVYYLLLISIILLIPITLYAGKGCCSHHGGQSYCDTSTGRWVCRDGTYSPSCTCYKKELEKNNSNNSTIRDSLGLNDYNSYNTNSEEKQKEEKMSTFEIIGCIILGLPLVAGVIGVIINRIRTGHWWSGQGYGK